MYVSQNAPRIARALFEICLRRGWSSAAELCLTLSKAFELRLWPEQHPLRQFEQALPFELLRKLEDRQLGLDQLAVSRAGARQLLLALAEPAVCMDRREHTRLAEGGTSCCPVCRSPRPALPLARQLPPARLPAISGHGPPRDWQRAAPPGGGQPGRQCGGELPLPPGTA